VRARPAAVALAAGLALAVPSAARAEQTATQRFFTERLLADPGTSREIKDRLRTRQGFVDRTATFKDLTGDERADAVVRVQSGGALGAVAVYVFSTDTGEKGSGLRVVFRSQELRRAQTRVRDGVLRYRTARPEPGDELCCPTKVAETRLRWRERLHRFTVAERREIAPTEPWGDQLSGSRARAG
jgi:hypothetical protein